MAEYAVATAFTARDRITGAFRAMGRGAGVFENKATKSFRNVGRAGSRVGDIIKGIIGAQLITRGIGALTQGLRTVTTEFISFDQAITSASSKFKDLDLATEAGQKTLKALGRTARDVGSVTQFTAGQAAEGLDFLAMAGFNVEQAMISLAPTVDLATVGQLDLGRATDIASDSLGAFGLMTENTADLQKNFTRLNDVMALTMSRTNTNMEDMFESIKKGAPAFTAAGQSMESFNTLLGVMANSGVKGSESGTVLRNMMIRLSKPTGAAQKAIEQLGINTQDAQGNFRDIVDILGDFEVGLKGMGTAQRTAALSTIYGGRAVTGVNILLGEGTDKLRAFRNELLNAGGASKNMADIIRQSLQNRLAALRSATIEVGFKFVEAFEKKGGAAIDALTEAVRNFDVEKVLNFAKKAVELFKQWKPVIFGIVAGFIAYNAAVKIMIALNAIKTFFGLVKAIQAAAAAQGIFNVIMAANPIGAIALAVAGLVALLVMLESKFKIFTKIKEWFAGGDPAGISDDAWKYSEYGGGRGPIRTAPNAAAAGGILKGRIDIAGAPAGSTATDTGSTGSARNIDYRMLGQN